MKFINTREDILLALAAANGGRMTRGALQRKYGHRANFATTLALLCEQGVVETSNEQPRPRGRPVTWYRLR